MRGQMDDRHGTGDGPLRRQRLVAARRDLDAVQFPNVSPARSARSCPSSRRHEVEADVGLDRLGPEVPHVRIQEHLLVRLEAERDALRERSVMFGFCVGIMSCGKGSSGAAPVQPMLSNGPCRKLSSSVSAPPYPHIAKWCAPGGMRSVKLRDVHRLLDRQPAVLAHLEVLARLDRVGAHAHLEATARFPEVGAGADVRCHGRREHQQGEGSHRGRLESERLGGQAECAPGIENPPRGGRRRASTRRVVGGKPILTDRRAGDTGAACGPDQSVNRLGSMAGNVHPRRQRVGCAHLVRRKEGKEMGVLRSAAIVMLGALVGTATAQVIRRRCPPPSSTSTTWKLRAACRARAADHRVQQPRYHVRRVRR